ncbi:MAG: recombinase family protein [Campylobacteraceae bacterium]|nr:recombinase family protein [Campylobacteraceae bacterium]
MAIVLLKNVSEQVNIIEQQQAVLKYATMHGIPIRSTEIETSDPSLSLERRKELKGFLRSLNNNETILLYNLWALSSHIDELIKIFECLLKRNIALHICTTGEIVSNKSQLLDVVSILTRLRNKSINPKAQTTQGRPKGRMSKSKFDVYRSQVILMLENGTSVSEIAKSLKVSRSSLKDYINSRGLKELAKTKKRLLHATPVKPKPKQPSVQQECDLISVLIPS